MAPTSTEVIALIEVFICVIWGFVVLVRVAHNERDERASENNKQWRNL